MAVLINRYSLWQYILIILIIGVAFVYAAPNLYASYPAVQIRGANAAVVDNRALETSSAALQKANIHYQRTQFQDQTLMFLFASTDVQLKAREVIQQALGEDYLVAINLASSTPAWLRAIGAQPMKLGLDLRGGVHFLLQVDVDSVMKQRVEGDLRGIGQALRDEHIRYSGFNRESSQEVTLNFRTQEALDSAYQFVLGRYREFGWKKLPRTHAGEFVLQGTLSGETLISARKET